MVNEKKEHVAIREVAGRHELLVGDRCIAACVSRESLLAARSLLVGSKWESFTDLLENV
jgi:hypothetical protein